MYKKKEIVKIKEHSEMSKEYWNRFALNSAVKKQEGFDMDFLAMLNLQTILIDK